MIIKIAYHSGVLFFFIFACYIIYNDSKEVIKVKTVFVVTHICLPEEVTILDGIYSSKEKAIKAIERLQVPNVYFQIQEATIDINMF